jgi:hypothetical protein
VKPRMLIWQPLSIVGISAGLLTILLLLISPMALWRQTDRVKAAGVIPGSNQLDNMSALSAASDQHEVTPAEAKLAHSETYSTPPIANVHQRWRLVDQSNIFASNQSGMRSEFQYKEPYLLADYAAQCEANMGAVPEFSCTQLDHKNILYASVLTVSNEARICPRLGVDEHCVITGTVEGRLITPTNAPADARVTVLFSCRRYDTLTPPGRFDDIAVIQYDLETGNTCWFQSPTIYAFDNRGNVPQDRFGYPVYQDWPGERVPSPMSFGAHNFWLHPFHPDDVIGENYVGDMLAGKRGVVADMNCQRCHDTDPFIWTPYLSTTHVLSNSGFTSPLGWQRDLNYVANFLGLFNGDGIHREQPRRLGLGDSISCQDCHAYLGENTMSRSKPIPERAYGSPVAPLLEMIHSDMITSNVIWMPPLEYGSALLTDEVKEELHDCAAGLVVSNCTLTNTAPANRASLWLETRSEPAILLAGHIVSYTISLRNRGVHMAPADTASGLSIIAILPDGATVADKPDGCEEETVSDAIQVTCQIGTLANNQGVTLSLAVQVDVDGVADTYTNTVVVKSSETTDDLNVYRIQRLNVDPVRRDVDLSLSQTALLEPVLGSNPAQYQLKYTLSVSNAGPAVASDVVLNQQLPLGAEYDTGLSSAHCTENAGLVTCTLGNLNDGRISTIRLFAKVTANNGPFFVNTASVSARSPDSDSSNNQLTDALFEGEAMQATLPLVSLPGPRGPDLVVKSINLTPETAVVVIQNIGDTAILPEDGFWVDLYIDPLLAPGAVNQTVQVLNSDGLVWGVLAPGIYLAPGQEFTLDVSSEYFVHRRSSIPRNILAGSVIFVQVDSANVNSDYGGIFEAHERFGEAYNNIVSFTLAEDVPTANWPLNLNDRAIAGSADAQTAPKAPRRR